MACSGITSRFTFSERRVQQGSKTNGNRKDKIIHWCGCHGKSIAEDGVVMDMVRADNVEGEAFQLCIKR